MTGSKDDVSLFTRKKYMNNIIPSLLSGFPG